MKGITVWLWVIASFIVGLMMFVVSLQFIGFVTVAREKELARGSLDDLASNANGLCANFVGSNIMKAVQLPEKVSSVYATSDIRVFPNDSRTFGNNLCMNFSNEIICDDLSCNVGMQTIVSGTTLQNLLNQFLGRFGTNSYNLQILKTDCGVSILQLGQTAFCPAECTNENKLVGCQKHNIIGLIENNTLVMTDFTPIFECCDQFPYIVTFLENTAKYFGGSKIMIVWESNFANPENAKYKPINDALKADGFEIISFQHKQQLTADDLKDKNQLWLYLPGWCSMQSDVQKTVECTEFTQWDDSEYGIMKDFVDSGGKLFIVTDYSPYTTQTVVNNILTNLGYSSRVRGTNVCGLGNIVTTTDIISNPITQNINEFSFLATSEIVC